MSYRILKTNGVKIKDLSDEEIDTETLSNIGLIGRLTPNYGETQSNNFVHLLENFANFSAPENALDGQLWYKKISLDIGSHEGDLYLCVNENESNYTDDGLVNTEKWKKLPIVFIGKEEPSNDSITGDMWYDETNHIFKMYDMEIAGDEKSKGWISIGPANFNDEKTTVKEDDSIVSDSESDEANITIYDFDKDLNIIEQNNRNIGYLLTLSVIGKEVINGENPGGIIDNNSCYISGWKIQAVINCYRKSQSEVKYEIVDQPDYELIGTNNRDWDVKLFFDTENLSKLKLKVKGKPRSGYKSKWKVKTDMLKVS